MHCAPFLLTMQIIFASVSYRRVVADLRKERLFEGDFCMYLFSDVEGVLIVSVSDKIILDC